MAYKAPKGTRDVLPEESYRWQRLEALIREIVQKYGLQEVRTPVIEHTELFFARRWRYDGHRAEGDVHL